jgi:flagellar motor switch protein FliG
VSSAQPPATSNSRKAAILLVLLGDEAATGICKFLPKEELRLLAQEISQLDDISPAMATEVLQEYQRLTAGHDSLAQGGPEYAAKILVKTLGDEGSKPLIDQVVRSQESATKNLEALQKVEPQRLATLLQEEHPQTIALVLAQLNGYIARTVLLLLPETVRGQAVKCLAQIQKFSPEVVSKISAVLHRKLFSAVSEQNLRPYGGVKAAAELLNRVGGDVTTSILTGIEQDNAQLANTIRDQMFTFEDFINVPDTGLRELLAQVDKKMLATSLRGASENLQSHFYKCMSSRAVEMLKEDSEALGAVRPKDIKQAQSEVIATARKLESQGKMALKNQAEEADVV